MQKTQNGAKEQGVSTEYASYRDYISIDVVWSRHIWITVL